MDLNEKNKKRVNNGGEPDQQEDEKMEKFFSLIRSFREARDRRRNELKELETMKNNKNTTMTMKMMVKNKRLKTEHEEQKKSSWVPSFEWEDFTEDQVKFRKLPLFFPGLSNKNHEQSKNDKIDKEIGLDLNLRL